MVRYIARLELGVMESGERGADCIAERETETWSNGERILMEYENNTNLGWVDFYILKMDIGFRLRMRCVKVCVYLDMA